MKLFGLVKQVWIIDEGMSIPDADSVELYESQAERDERLLYLNGGHGEDYFRPPFLTESFCDQHKRRLFTKTPELYPQFASYGKSDEDRYFVDGQIVKYVNGKRI